MDKKFPGFFASLASAWRHRPEWHWQIEFAAVDLRKRCAHKRHTDGSGARRRSCMGARTST
jgi:hypothetical protein